MDVQEHVEICTYCSTIARTSAANNGAAFSGGAGREVVYVVYFTPTFCQCYDILAQYTWFC